MFKRKTDYSKVIWELQQLISYCSTRTYNSTLKEFFKKVYRQLQEKNLLDIHCNLLLVNKEYKDFFNREIINVLFLSRYWCETKKKKEYEEELRDIDRLIQ